ncbi:hypothetical protein C6380_27280 [Pseudomonas syringae pv. actinidiae]|nr:hypothetical protein BUE61_26270 [Pseudomonas syringae pv. actinidiae]RJX47807.1 hypothetical protein C6380_27280 [Pseudomonas syringae pv. actinidiae]RJX53958.1 hypothetical protein C6383_27200 [Pseudomonas syringae pv. actinidiae]RJX61003.1 hypothetical protein C6379_05285 [Pseudomonas syringae pv. actinidiae]RJY20786.1 hypothetical protein C6381_21860 [Pseudomonas syringae pv. actinidiae]
MATSNGNSTRLTSLRSSTWPALGSTWFKLLVYAFASTRAAPRIAVARSAARGAMQIAPLLLAQLTRNAWCFFEIKCLRL